MRADVGVDAIVATIVATTLGSEVLWSALADGHDLRGRISNTWAVLLPAIVPEKSLGYYREFLARQSLRSPTPNL
jgi:hypothetical protein